MTPHSETPCPHSKLMLVMVLVDIDSHIGPEDNLCPAKISKDSVLAKLSDLMSGFQICKF